jgi:hypothetical protein
MGCFSRTVDDRQVDWPVPLAIEAWVLVAANVVASFIRFGELLALSRLARATLQSLFRCPTLR